MKDQITKEHILRHPIDKVWSAISKSEEISSWFIKADFKAEVGYNYTFEAGEDKGCISINGIVKEATPYTLVYTWVVQNTNIETTVKWMLESIEGGTKLYLEHSGISNYPGETAVKMFSSFDGGWNQCIDGLVQYLTQTIHAK